MLLQMAVSHEELRHNEDLFWFMIPGNVVCVEASLAVDVRMTLCAGWGSEGTS